MSMKSKEPVPKWKRVKEIAEEINHKELLNIANQNLKENINRVNKSRNKNT